VITGTKVLDASMVALVVGACFLDPSQPAIKNKENLQPKREV